VAGDRVAGPTVTGTSSLTMMPCPWPSAMAAPVADARSTRNVSLDSGVVSPLTCTVTVCVVWPAAKFSTPLVAA